MGEDKRGKARKTKTRLSDCGRLYRLGLKNMNFTFKAIESLMKGFKYQSKWSD